MMYQLGLNGAKRRIMVLMLLSFLLPGCLSEVERCLKDNHPEKLTEQQKIDVEKTCRKIANEELRQDRDFCVKQRDVAYKYEKENIAIFACMDRYSYSEVGPAAANYFDTIREYFF